MDDNSTVNYFSIYAYVLKYILFLKQVHNLKKDGRTGRTVVCVGTITDDLRLYEVPKMKV